jgi:hypothetical protein
MELIWMIFIFSACLIAAEILADLLYSAVSFILEAVQIIGETVYRLSFFICTKLFKSLR